MARYLDSSALVKLVLMEPESDRLRAHLTDASPATSSALAEIEVTRAVDRVGADKAATSRVHDVLATIELRRIDTGIIGAAARLAPAELRSLDAIHLATALELGDELIEFVAYDRRLLKAADDRGIPTLSP